VKNSCLALASWAPASAGVTALDLGAVFRPVIPAKAGNPRVFTTDSLGGERGTATGAFSGRGGPGEGVTREQIKKQYSKTRAVDQYGAWRPGPRYARFLCAGTRCEYISISVGY